MKTKKVTESEVRFRIEQALSLSPKITIGMLQAFLTSRVSGNTRDAVLAVMVAEKKVKIIDMVFRSYSGHGSTAKVVERVGGNGV